MSEEAPQYGPEEGNGHAVKPLGPVELGAILGGREPTEDEKTRLVPTLQAVLAQEQQVRAMLDTMNRLLIVIVRMWGRAGMLELDGRAIGGIPNGTQLRIQKGKQGHTRLTIAVPAEAQHSGILGPDGNPVPKLK